MSASILAGGRSDGKEQHFTAAIPIVGQCRTLPVAGPFVWSQCEIRGSRMAIALRQKARPEKMDQKMGDLR
jgi:hypothetical protein